MILQKSQSIYILMLIYAIIISMSNYEIYSANSQNIKHFKLKQKMKNLIIIVIIGIPILLGVAVYYYYRNITDPSKSTVKKGTQTSLLGATSNEHEISANNSSQQLPGHDSLYNSANAQNLNNQSTPSNIAESNNQNSKSSIPSSVTTIINYTETKGSTNNPYIHPDLDTSPFKNATKITFNKNSWAQYGQNQGSMDFSVQFSGKTKDGTATFSIDNGAWKIIGYGLKD